MSRKHQRGNRKNRHQKSHSSPQSGHFFGNSQKDSSRGSGRGFFKDSPRDSQGRKNSRSGEGRSRSFKKSKNYAAETLVATVQKNKKGFAFLVFESSGYEDVYLDADRASSLFNGDRIEVSFRPSSREVLNFRVIEHRIKEIVGYFAASLEFGMGHIIYEKKNVSEQIPIQKLDLKMRPKSGDWVRAKLHFKENSQTPIIAEVIEVFGKSIPARADINLIRGEYGLEEHHSSQAIQEAQSFSPEILIKDFPDRKDLTSESFITIDGEDARDFDDAVLVKRLKPHIYQLEVAIADVAHYVQVGKKLDKDAYERGTSVYFPERAFHMLPKELSEDLCSLKPNVNRLVLVASMQIDALGKVQKIYVYEGIINSKKRWTYTELQNEYEAQQKNPNWEFHPHFELYEILKRARKQRGSIDFDLKEIKITCDPTPEHEGEVKFISVRERQDTHRLIEEFMISANEAVTQWMVKRKQPFIYRIHEEPSEESLQKFSLLAKSVGIQVRLDRNIKPKMLSDLLEKIKGHTAEVLLNSSMLRALKQAVYSAKHAGHFGLASNGYTHFTSPIRRYPDLVVHRLIKAVVRNSSHSSKDLGGQSKKLEEISKHCSYRERLAADAERDMVKLKQIRWMEKNLGREFDGSINGFNDYGIFVRLNEPPIEGFVSQELLTDDFYEFNPDRMIFSGRRKKRTFKIGDQIKVQSLRVDFIRRQIDLKLI